MALVKSKAIVLGFIKYGETSIIARLFTREIGLISVMVKGVRASSKQSKATLYQSMNVIEVVLNNKPNVKLHFLRDASRAIQFNELPFDHVKRSSGLFLTEVISKCIQENQVWEEFYDFMENKLIEMDQLKYIDKNTLIFSLLEITQLMGFFPLTDESGAQYFDLKEGCFTNQFNEFALEKSDSKLLKSILDALNFGQKIDINHTDRIRIIDILLLYFEMHVEHFGKLKSLEVLREL